MTQKLDYSREEAMQILNSQNYSDEEKRKLYESYMNDLRKNRKNLIVAKLNEYAKNIPTITKEIYISKIKEYENDDLSKPFEIIEQELINFEKEMQSKYDEYLKSKQKVQEPVVETSSINQVPNQEEEDFDDTIFSDKAFDIDEEVKPSLVITDEYSVINEEPEEKVKPLFENSNDESKDVIIEDEEKEKGNASAIIISIIALIIGILVMYSIIKFN